MKLDFKNKVIDTTLSEVTNKRIDEFVAELFGRGGDSVEVLEEVVEKNSANFRDLVVAIFVDLIEQLEVIE